jgi:hypothetical protein
MLCLRSARLSCALLALSIAPGFATVVTYSDITAWQNATAAGFTTITFDNLASINNSTSYTTGLLIGDGTNFFGWTPNGGSLYVYNQAPGSSSWNNYGSGSVLAGPTCCFGSPYINITLPRPVTSVGFNIMTGGSSGISFNATLNTLGSTPYTSARTLPWSYPNPTLAFFGFTTTADTPMTNIFLSLPSSASNFYPIIDNFSYGTTATDPPPADTPEVCTLLLIGLGLTGMSIFHRRLRRVAAAVAV